MGNNYDDLMTYNNYAIMKGVTQQTVRNWVESGKVKRVVIDGRSYVKVTKDEMMNKKRM